MSGAAELGYVSGRQLWTVRKKTSREKAKKALQAAGNSTNSPQAVLVVSDLATMHVVENDFQIRWHRVFAPKVLRAKDLPPRT